MPFAPFVTETTSTSKYHLPELLGSAVATTSPPRFVVDCTVRTSSPTCTHQWLTLMSNIGGTFGGETGGEAGGDTGGGELGGEVIGAIVFKTCSISALSWALSASSEAILASFVVFSSTNVLT